MEVTIIYGCMFAGKSSMLIKLIKQQIVAGDANKCLVINHRSDARYGHNKIITHGGKSIGAVMAENLSDVDTSDKLYIFIDEAQFFDDILDFIDELKYEGVVKHLYVAGLDRTYQGKYFGHMGTLINDANYEKIRLRAVCKCGHFATLTRRIIDSDELIITGGAEIYEPVCKRCFWG